ncbi:hypothetical protein AVEN_209229-1 [Araneus ventricosus]|uniref:Uncharacterized protein n=1 Tax=Araneus ventricosus TaxID=182803 RepID=A0A4Y2M1L3_ARAVE|nr:hypothetical protein AVEN_209229-1 [Araneus ventricosus]
MWGTWGTRKLMSWPKRQLRPRRQQCLWISFPEAVQTRSQAVSPGQVAEALKHDQTLRVFEAYEKHPKSHGHMAKSSQMRLGLPSTVVVGDLFGVSDRAVVAIVSSVLHHVGLITSNNSDLVVDENKLRREKAKVRKDLKSQALSEAQAIPLKGLYFDGRKDSTLIEERVDTKRYTRKSKEEHLCLIEELASRYIIHLSPSFGTAKQISATIIGYFEGIPRDLFQF